MDTPALRTYSYDLVVEEVRLSEREGFAVLREQQLHGRTTPVFVLTALACQGPSGAVRDAASPDDSGVDSVDAGLLAREMQQAIEYGHRAVSAGQGDAKKLSDTRR